VSILVLPQSTPAALYGLYEVFASVGRTWEELTGEPSDTRNLEPRLVARSLDPIQSALGFAITPNGVLDDADVVIVTDIAIPRHRPPAAVWDRELAWLRERHAAGAILCSVCTGTTVLAEAGLLDGLEATTHWSTVEFMRARYPGPPRAAEDPRGRRSGRPDRDGGRGDGLGGHGALPRGASRKPGRSHPDREDLPSRRPLRRTTPLRGREESRDGTTTGWWPTSRPGSPTTTTCRTRSRSMVERSGLSERTFIRRFRAATGYAPMEYVQTLRIEEAKHLLETTRTPIEMIAVEAGYEDPNFFRRLFKRRVGITPARYRQRFAAILRR
jgi:transcriptional regulator GlxA family with amidase domain